MTVTGEIASSELSVTLVHEHLYSDMTSLLAVHGYRTTGSDTLDQSTAAEARWNPGAFPDNYRLTDVQLAIAELEPVVASGCKTIVDATPVGLGRSPERLVEIARRTGLHVVMGSGWYLEGTHPPYVAERRVDELSELLVEEIRNGAEGTHVRPGIIGEIGTGATWSAQEEKVLRAAAQAQRETRLALTIHLHPWSKNGLRVLDVLDGEGVNPAKTILNHMTTAIDDHAYQRALLDRGVFLAYDLFGFDHSLLGLGRYPPSDFDTARRIVELAEQGFARQLLISQDVGVKTRLRAYGGWGYGHLFDHVLPLLSELGLGAEERSMLVVENPRRALEVE